MRTRIVERRSIAGRAPVASSRGYSLVELLVVVGMLLVLSASAAPALRAYSLEAQLLGAGREFKGEFQKTRSVAVMKGTNTALRFEPGPDGGMYYSTYTDGNHNGVLAVDIESGVDPRLAGPFRLTGRADRVRVGINPGTYAIPPETGVLDTSDPIRFGRSNMISFSPLGTATPGTLYLAGAGLQGAVRVTGTTARVRLLINRGKKWIER